MGGWMIARRQLRSILYGVGASLITTSTETKQESSNRPHRYRQPGLAQFDAGPYFLCPDGSVSSDLSCPDDIAVLTGLRLRVSHSAPI